MVDHRSRFRSQQDPDFEGYNEDISGRGARSGARSYSFGRTARQDFGEDESAPLFLSDSDDEYAFDQDGGQDPWESPGLLRKNKSSVSLKILMGVLAASAVAMLFALFTSDAMRDAIDSAKASFATVLPVPSAAAQSDQTQLTARDIQLKDPTRLGAAAGRAPQPQTQIAMASPSREEISSAYQSAIQRAPAAPPAGGPQPVTALPPPAPPVAAAPPPAAPQQLAALPPPAAAAPATMATPVAPPVVGPSPVVMPSPIVRHIDPDELAMLLNRAKGLLQSGDIPPARLLLERAADAQDALAAYLLAQTYDPDVLGARDARTITPDLVAARAWYQKAAQLGSAEAQRRLAQIQN
jgi:TPR repeat protein